MTNLSREEAALAELIASELDYFEPMISRANRSTREQRDQWAGETVRERHERVSHEVYALCNGTVKYGPFRGMQLSSKRWWGGRDLGSQCLGLYEKEILDVIETMPVGGCNTFIDIGAADGYYAIGMLLSGKARRAVCFESSEVGRSTILENWELNGRPGTLTCYAEATPSSLARLLPDELQDSLVLIDIEGAEFMVLSDEVLPLLSKFEVMIEIHNWVDNFADQYAALLARLHKWFQITAIERAERGTFHLAELRDFTDDNRALLTSESRPCVMRFLRLRPKNGA